MRKAKLSVTISRNVSRDPNAALWCVVCGRENFAKGYLGWGEFEAAIVVRVTSSDGRRPAAGGGPYFAHPFHSSSEVKRAAKNEFLFALGEI